MKKTILTLSLILICFSSCKEECKTCSYKVYYIGDSNTDTLRNEEMYCGDVLDIIESEPTTTTIGKLRRERECD
jgi:hypothetical protein